LGTSSLILERTTVHISDDSGRIAMLERRTICTDESEEELVVIFIPIIFNHPL